VARSPYTVFAQRSDARFEVNEWDQRARRFFDAKVGLATPKTYDASPPTRDEGGVVLARHEEVGTIRHVVARPREARDLEDAEAADARVGSPGLGLLARRCGYVFLVETVSDDDRDALLLAAILASVMLGPILTPERDRIFGVKTARALLEREPHAPH